MAYSISGGDYKGNHINSQGNVLSSAWLLQSPVLRLFVHGVDGVFFAFSGQNPCLLDPCTKRGGLSSDPEKTILSLGKCGAGRVEQILFSLAPRRGEVEAHHPCTSSYEQSSSSQGAIFRSK